jgi:hypothetical protein
MSREKLTRAFLWLSILGWAIALGAKLYDLAVLAGAWSAAPPASFDLLPYGKRWPVDPGDFFQPLSVVMTIGILGTVIAGWKTPWNYRGWLVVPLLAFLIAWAVTPTIFWPMISELWGIHTGRLARTDAEAIQLAHRWIVSDSLRVVLMLAGFLSYVRAMSVPFPRQE